MNVQKFVTVVQRRSIAGEESFVKQIEPLFAIETHLSMEERLVLLKSAHGLPEGFVACEVGSYVGASTCFLAFAARLRGGKIHCVDTWDGRAMGMETPRDSFAEFMRNTEPFCECLVTHRGESSAMAPAVPAGLDLLFIDGDHSYAAVKSDLLAYGPKIKPGGLLALHDFDYASVRQACAEYLHVRRAENAGRTHNLQGFRMGPH